MKANDSRRRQGHREKRVCWLVPGAAIFLLVTLTIAGCGPESELPTVELSATAIAPVGKVIPVYIKSRCVAHCGFKSIPPDRSDITALNEAGQYVPAMSVSDAAAEAGGSEKLLIAAGSTEGNALFLTRQTVAGIDQVGRSFGAGGLLFIPLILGYTAYMATDPEAVRRDRLTEISIAHGHYSGWAFFPLGKYSQVRVPYKWMDPPPLWSGPITEHSEMATTPWNGSSVTPSPFVGTKKAVAE